MYKTKLSLFVNSPPVSEILISGWRSPSWLRVDVGEFHLLCSGQFTGKTIFCPPIVYRDANDVLHCFQLKESDTTADRLVFENWNPATGGCEDVDSNPIHLMIELY